MKNKKEFSSFVLKELRRVGFSDVELPFDYILAFANIVYLTGALDALQDERVRQQRIFAEPKKKARDRS